RRQPARRHPQRPAGALDDQRRPSLRRVRALEERALPTLIDKSETAEAAESAEISGLCALCVLRGSLLTPARVCGLYFPESSTQKVVPTPTADSHRIDPPSAWTHSATIDSPSPEPATPSSPSRCAWARKKRSKIADRSSSSIPRPLSRTVSV